MEIMSPASDADALWEELFQFIDAGKVVPVVGQDLLMVRTGGRQVQLYSYLAERLAELWGIATDPGTAPTLNTVVCRYVEQGRPVQNVYSALGRVMPKSDQIELPESLLHLAEIRQFNLFVTTTFDSLLETALNRTRFGDNALTTSVVYSLDRGGDLPPDLEDSGRPIVFYLLGRLSVMPVYAVTDEDMLEFIHRLQSENHRPKDLFDALRDKSLLIIGCAFPDWLARFFIRIAQNERLIEGRNKAWVADERIHGDDGLVFFLKHFSQLTQVFPGSAIDFVDELHRRWKGRAAVIGAQQPPPSGLPATPDVAMKGVFLSYASEDRVAVEAVKNALEAAGIEVWFDQAKLRMADAWKSKIATNIRKSLLFMPFMSRNTLKVTGREFREEWYAAVVEKRRRRKDFDFITPVTIDGTAYEEDKFPEEFGQYQWTKLPGGQVTDAFVKELQGKLSELQALQANMGAP